MVKLVYTQDLKSCALKKRVGSIPASGTQLVYKVHQIESYKVVVKYKHIGDWRNWLACTVWDREVAGSTPVSPTYIKIYRIFGWIYLLIYFKISFFQTK